MTYPINTCKTVTTCSDCVLMGCHWKPDPKGKANSFHCRGDDGGLAPMSSGTATTPGKINFGKGPTFADFQKSALKCKNDNGPENKYCRHTNKTITGTDTTLWTFGFQEGV